MTDLRIVQHDAATALSPLFRPLPCKKIREKLDIETKFAGGSLRWRGPDALGVQEETLLLVILEEARAAAQELSAEPRTAEGAELRRSLSPSGFLEKSSVVSFTTSFRSLASGCYGSKGGAEIRQIRYMLQRLVEVTLWVRNEGLEGSTRLLSWLIADDNSVRVALNRRLAEAIVDGQFVQISLGERLALRSQLARAVHSRLSARVRPAASIGSNLVSLEKLVWGNNEEGSTQRNRHSNLRNALGALGQLQGWVVSWSGRSFTVTRNATYYAPWKSDDILLEKRRQVKTVKPSNHAPFKAFLDKPLYILLGEQPPASGDAATYLPPRPPLVVEKGAPLRREPERQTLAQLDWFANLGVKCDVAVRKSDGRFIVPHSNLSDSDMRKLMPWLRARNANGSDIYVRPHRDGCWPVVFLDDVSTDIARSLAAQVPAFSIETSPGRCHVWIVMSVALTEHQRHIVQKHLAAGEVIEGLTADHGSTSGEHWGRLAGYKNHKPGRDCWANALTWSSGGAGLDVTPLLTAVLVDSRPRQRKPRASAEADSASEHEWAWVMSKLEAGGKPELILEQLEEHCTDRRGNDTRRYARLTLQKAQAVLSQKAIAPREANR